ncbi:insulinase family protein [Pseudomonas sp. 7P_10.2_Bac1]|uniref:M16 family metallopeptidase n=1 Tax=Pseudomonas sp. 7P_10.2_Bac1 TaxID=2971614 RepID=UPI0021C7D52A|nr:pitrilysin family protein [Pseudomonas sp. 7P_10.2_Bac1]MCU1729333.1 insulinase family protein [Pseudomonas sp. 7P_10.2_Bac1]
MSNASLVARCTLIGLIALLGVFLSVGCYVRASEYPSPTASLQSLRELAAPADATLAPPIQSWTLKQGSRVLFVENHNLPMVDLKISFAAGSYYDGETPGLAAMTQGLFTVDSALKQADEIDRGFDRYGVTITYGMNAEQSYFTLRSLSAPQSLAPVMSLLTETLSQPSFSQENLARIKRTLHADLKLEDIIAQARALAKIRAELYPGQPLSRSSNGTHDSLQQMDATQVRAFYQRAYTAANAQIVIVGDLTPEQARTLTQTLADALPQGPALPPPQTFVTTANTGKTLHIEDSTNQTLLMMAQNALPNTHPDAMAIRVAHVVFNHVLNDQLREKHSVTYGVESDIEHALGTSAWIIHFNTPPQYSQKALEQVNALFAQFLKDGPTEEQLDSIKKYTRQALPQLMATNKNVLNELAIINRFSQTQDLTRKTADIQKITPAQIKAAMNRHMNANNWVTVTLGPRVAQQPLPDIIRGEDNSRPVCNSTN